MARRAEPELDLAAFIERHTEEIAEPIHATIRLPDDRTDRGLLRWVDSCSRPRGSGSSSEREARGQWWA